MRRLSIDKQQPLVLYRHLPAIIVGFGCRESLLPLRGFPPTTSWRLQRLDFEVLPPGHFVAGLMQLPMMTAAEGYGELVADFEAEGPGLGKPQVMRIGRLPATDEAGLRGNEPQMGLVTQPLGLGDGEKALVDLRGQDRV